MRTHGTVDSARGHVPAGHLCWAYTSRSEFHDRAVEYLRDGIAAGQWIEYVGSGSTEALRAELGEADGLGPALQAGTIAVTPVEDFYTLHPGSSTVDPHAAVKARIAATEQALTAGYTGFRAVVDATTMVASAGQRAAFVQFERLIDQTMSTLPVTALCGYDLTELGSAAVAELACLHPLTNLETPFQLYSQPDGSLALAGVVDQHCAELFARALGHAAELTPDQDIVLDVQHLTAIEPAGLLDLNRLAREHDRRIVLRSAPPATAQLIQQLQPRHLRTEPEPDHEPG
ncbi:MEDS domain-containing protein [Bounagaea algeriensis]